MQLQFLGTGTSHGIPVIGCRCAVCTSDDPRDNRMRCSAVVYGNHDECLLIDCSPEFRMQALRSSLTHVTAVLLTHSHADHLHGLDDLRIFCKPEKDDNAASPFRSIPIYCNAATKKDVQRRFFYAFHKTQIGGGKPHFTLCPAEKRSIGTIPVTPVPLLHGKLKTCGWIIGTAAYLTDCSFIPPESLSLLRRSHITTLVIDALRERVHETHFSFNQALDVIAALQPTRAFFTHMCHDFSHQQMQNWIQQQKMVRDDIKCIDISPAYDNLVIDIANGTERT